VWLGVICTILQHAEARNKRYCGSASVMMKSAVAVVRCGAYPSIHLTVGVFGFTGAVERVASRIYVWLFLLLLSAHPCLHLVSLIVLFGTGKTIYPAQLGVVGTGL
jgi:hypothetical protein